MEHEYFTSFRHFEGDIHAGRIEHVDSPDFRIVTDTRIIGVEITRLFRPSGRQCIESEWDRILDVACGAAEKINLPAANVTLFFNLRRPLKAASRCKIGKAVARVVADGMPPDGASVALEKRPGQPTEVDLILVNRRYILPHSRWQWTEAGDAEANVTSIIQDAITRKARRLRTYLGSCDECWLLLVSDSFRTSGRMELAEYWQSQAFISPFIRTYVLDFGRGKLYRLQTTSMSP